jgi:hypothetical protein
VRLAVRAAQAQPALAARATALWVAQVALAEPML